MSLGIGGIKDKGWGHEIIDPKKSEIEQRCKNNIALLIVATITVITAIISALFVFEYFTFPPLFTALYSIAYGFAFCGIGFLMYVDWIMISEYRKEPLHQKDYGKLVVFYLGSIIAIIVILACVANIESAYYESHFHNALQSNTLHHAYSELDCRVIDKFRTFEHDNQPTWHPRLWDSKEGKLGWFEYPGLITIPEKCS